MKCYITLSYDYFGPNSSDEVNDMTAHLNIYPMLDHDVL